MITNWIIFESTDHQLTVSKILWFTNKGQFYKFSNRRVPQLNQNQVYIFAYKTNDTIARSNEVNKTVRRKLSLRDVGQDGVEFNPNLFLGNLHCMCVYLEQYNSWNYWEAMGTFGSVKIKRKQQKSCFLCWCTRSASYPSPGRGAAESCEHLRATCEELRATCEELRATCEELRATCEELRATSGSLQQGAATLGKSFSSLVYNRGSSDVLLLEGSWLLLHLCRASISRYFSWGFIIGIRAGRFSIGPCHESEQFLPKQYRPFGPGLFTLKPSRAEPDQLSIVYGRQCILV
ncbi:hypothetical protein QL285_034531 [Trifolium repens]|nr:hypothetical protein QL285_034531 [Trifolium repens]